MAPYTALATGIVNSMSHLWKDETLADFTVEIEMSVFRCHRFILGACSKFFYAMFKSDMREKKDNSVKLHDVDLSIFELILKVLYTGENVVTKENVLSIWQCAHRLQITFLVEHCETFVVSILSLENYVKFSRAGKLFDSIPVLKGIQDFILKNFIKVRNDDYFLDLSEDEILDLIKNDELNVYPEDEVLLSILKWVQMSSDENSCLKTKPEANTCNSALTNMPETNLIDDEERAFTKNHTPEMQKPQQNRAAHLLSLLKASRSCLASPKCLQTLYHHPLIQSKEDAKRVIFDAILYQVKGCRHGYFPPAALLRNCAECHHVVLIMCEGGSFQLLSLKTDQWFRMPTCLVNIHEIRLALFDRDIYAVGQTFDPSSQLCVYKEGSWVNVKKLSGLRYFLLSHEAFLYVFDASSGEIYRMQPSRYDESPQIFAHLKETMTVEFVLSFNEYIIVFSKDFLGSPNETTVYYMNPQNLTWRLLRNLDGSAANMATFQDCDKVYVLQSNGKLWLLSSEKIITFQCIHKLWDKEECLRGAMLFKEVLYIYFTLPRANPKSQILPSLEGVYKSVQTWVRNVYVSNFICTIMRLGVDV